MIKLDEQLYNYGLSGRLDIVYSELTILTEEETGPEKREYNEFLLDTVQEAVQYIYTKEKEK